MGDILVCRSVSQSQLIILQNISFSLATVTGVKIVGQIGADGSVLILGAAVPAVRIRPE